MRILLNEIIDELYDAVKQAREEEAFSLLERKVGELVARHSDRVVMSALCWLVVTQHFMLKHKEKEEKRRKGI